MASPTKPPAPTGPLTADSDVEFEAAVERVQRRDVTQSRKGFDEERQQEEESAEASPTPDEADEGGPIQEGLPPEKPAPGAWTPFSDE